MYFGGSQIRQGVEVTPGDMHDKIINLRFIHKNEEAGKSFTIRSDYEPVFYPDGSMSFKRCVEKPDIKVSYKQVSNAVAIEVDIEITNYFTADKAGEGTKLITAINDDPVQQCIIQMGYIGQFADWTDPLIKRSIDDYYTLRDNSGMLRNKESGIKEIQVQILGCYAKSLPPNAVLYFKGIVGTVENGLRWQGGSEEYIKGYGDPDVPNELSEIEDVLFQWITRRFIRSSVTHRVLTNRNYTNKESLDALAARRYEQEVEVLEDEDSEEDTHALKVLTEEKPHKRKWVTLELVKGIMTVEDAEKYGITCVVSETLRKMVSAVVEHGNVTEAEARALTGMPMTVFSEQMLTLGGQLDEIQKHYPFIRWVMRPEGDIWFFHVDDADLDIWSDRYIQDNRPIPLPAVYDMTPEGTRIIRCPFTGFIAPTQVVQFESRYSIGTFTSYFYPVDTNTFLVIMAAVDFATVQDDNLMELTCVDQPRQKIEDIYAKAERFEEKAEEQKKRNRWIKRELTVVQHRLNATHTDSRVENIVANHYVVFGMDEETAFNQFREHSSHLFDPGGEYMSRHYSGRGGKSIENREGGIGHRYGVEVPWLLEGDKVVVHFPVMPEYDPADMVEAV